MEARDAESSEMHDARIGAVVFDADAGRLTFHFSHVPFYFREANAFTHTLHGFAIDLLGEGVSEIVGQQLESDAWVSDGELHALDGRRIDLVEVARTPARDVRVEIVTNQGTRLAFRAAPRPFESSMRPRMAFRSRVRSERRDENGPHTVCAQHLACPPDKARVGPLGRSGYPMRMSVVLKWNGTDLPEELRRAPEGRYLLVRIDGDAPALTDEEDAGLEAALASVRSGRGVTIDDARQQVSARLRR